MTETRTHNKYDGKLDRKETGTFNENGITEGVVYYYNNDGEIIITYTGTFKNGELNGEGEIIDYEEDGRITRSTKD